MNYLSSIFIFLSFLLPTTFNSSPEPSGSSIKINDGSQFSNFNNLDNDVCYFVGQISMSAVSAGAFYTCFQTGTPSACTIGYAIINCQKTKACDGVIKKTTSKGCTYIVKKVGDTFEIAGESTREKLEELKKTYDSLNSVEGMMWLKHYLR